VAAVSWIVTDPHQDPDHAQAQGQAGDEEAIILRAGSGKWLWILLGSLVFVLFGAATALGRHTGTPAKIIGGLVIVLFAFCAVTALRQILVPDSLIITSEAVEIVGRRRHTRYAMADCGRFFTWRNPNSARTIVVFDYAPDDDTELGRQNRALTGASRSIPGGYGIAADDLARLLNQARTASR
jgi:hypothetical protein